MRAPAVLTRLSRGGWSAVLTCTAAASCMTWRPAADPTQALARRPAVPRARLVLRDSTRVTLEQPLLRGDMVVGEIWRGGRTVAAVPLDSVVRVERARYSAARTLGLTAALAAGAWLLYVAAFMLSVGPNY